jgi:hypothetical protein
MRNGPKGISLFIVMCLGYEFNEKNIISATPTIAPIQKDNNTALPPRDNPRNHPIPRASFPSPKPIHLPPDTNHKIKNGKNSISPERNDTNVGIKNANVEKLKNIPTNERAANVYTKLSGIILCFRS